MPLINLKLINALLFAPLAMLLTVMPTSSKALSASSEWVTTEQTSVRLIASSTTIGQSSETRLGVHFKLKKGWKVYWRSPGDAGFPPSINWQKSQNLDNAKFQWPAPSRFSVLGLETLGYKDEVVLPITAFVKDPTQPLALEAELSYLTCNEICIPYDTHLSMSLAPGTITPSDEAHLINRWVTTVPDDGSASRLAVEKAETYTRGDKGFLRISASAHEPFNSLDAYIEADPTLSFAKPTIQYMDKETKALLDIEVYGSKGFLKKLPDLPLQVTLVDGQRAAEFSVASLNIDAPAPLDVRPGDRITGSQPTSLLVILGLAVIGGLILNLMPCVLPVLSIKLLGLVSHGGGDQRQVRAGFLASAAGILVSFLILAGALIALKSAGSAIGWGIQFQNPFFLIIMTLLVILFACNMWGLFEFNIPAWIPSGGNSQGLAGNFLQGAFATLLATPCSAPFLGTAVGFALSRGSTEIFAVFTALGVGLALPYLLIAAVPSLATRMPRPGPWMVRLRQVLALALVATAIWLLSVLVASAGMTTTVVVATACIGVIVIMALSRSRSDAKRLPVNVVLVIVILMTVFSPNLIGKPSVQPLQANSGDAIWQPFEPEKIPQMVGDGKTVFVDVTADWCITCIVNKKLVLLEGDVYQRLKAENIIVMQADWTLPDPQIAAYLASFNRYGIPFNAVYGPAFPEGITLPELLTPGAVTEALDKVANIKISKK